LPVATQEQPRTLSESVVIHFLRARESHWEKSNIEHLQAIKVDGRFRELLDRESIPWPFGLGPVQKIALCRTHKMLKLFQQTIS
jgi:hypothetical protein